MDTRIRLLGVVTVLTVIFHHTLGQFQFGYSFVLFILAYLVAFHLVVFWQHRITNRWAYLFLVPVAAALYGQAMYASDLVRVLAFFTAPINLAFFSYWSTAPLRSFRDIFSLTPFTLFKETVFPFKNYSEHFSIKSSISSRQVWQVLLGIGVGLPVLFVVVALFASADETFSRLFTSITSLSFFPQQGGRLLLDLLLGIFLVGFFGTIVRRHLLTPAAIQTSEHEPFFKEKLSLHTFLVALNAIFAVFVVIQILYVVQGSGHWQATGLTYADYAKQSFYQLFWVAVIVFAVACFSYRQAGIQARLTRILLLILIVQTGVVIASAATRLGLYISVYSLTVARWWGAIELAFITLLLLWCAVCIIRRVHLFRFFQGSIIGTVLLCTPLLLINHEAIVANYNVNRFLAHETTYVDASYLRTLSSDGVPSLMKLYNGSKSGSTDLRLGCGTGFSEVDCLRIELRRKAEFLREQAEKDWRLLVRSDRYALEMLNALQL